MKCLLRWVSWTSSNHATTSVSDHCVTTLSERLLEGPIRLGLSRLSPWLLEDGVLLVGLVGDSFVSIPAEGFLAFLLLGVSMWDRWAIEDLSTGLLGLSTFLPLLLDLSTGLLREESSSAGNGFLVLLSGRSSSGLPRSSESKPNSESEPLSVPANNNE